MLSADCNSVFSRAAAGSDYTLMFSPLLTASGSQKSNERSKACIKEFVMHDALGLHSILSTTDET